MTLLGIPGQYQENILSYRQKGGLAYKTTALSSTFSPHGFRVPEEADVRALPSALLQTNQRTSLPNEQPQVRLRCSISWFSAIKHFRDFRLWMLRYR